MSMKSAMDALSKAPAPSVPNNVVNSGANDPAPIEAAKPTDPIAAVTPESTPGAPKPDDSSSKFSALAKREKGLVQKQNEIKAREAAFAAKEAAISAREAEIAAREQRIKESDELWESDAFGAIEKRGYSYQKLTDLMLSGQKVGEKKPVDPAELVAKKLEEFEKKQTERETAREAAQRKADEDAQKKQEEQLAVAYETFKNELSDFVKAHDADYELINLYDQAPLVVDTIQAYFDEHQKVLSHKEACDMVEKYLEEEAQKAMKSKKFTKSSEPTKKEEKAAPSKTLSNDLTPTSASVLTPRNEQERMKRAMAALEKA